MTSAAERGAAPAGTTPRRAEPLAAGTTATRARDSGTSFQPDRSADGLAGKLADLDERLRGCASVVVAFSGGADSAFLLAAAARSGTEVLAATSTSASLASGEWEAAAEFARGLGVEHLRVETQELARPGYAANGPDRCYHCKSELLDLLVELARARGVAAVATGTNADDVREVHRPGLRAAAERLVITPLADSGFSKADVRAASAAWGLPTWNKPQAACLASRIAYGIPVDAERLARVDRAEAGVRRALSRAGINAVNLRVRDLGTEAVIEIDREHVAAASLCAEAVAAAVASGFESARVDSRGFRSGSLNESLLPGQRIAAARQASSWSLPLVD